MAKTFESVNNSMNTNAGPKRGMISILMPTYNDAGTIKESIKSIIRQSYKNWQLIIIDDASMDNTSLEVSKISDKRISYIHLDKNGDQLNALLAGAKFIKGDFVCFLHSDDIFSDDNALSRLFNSIGKYNEYDGCYADLVKFDNNLNRKGLLVSDDFRPQELIKHILNSFGGNPIFDMFFVKKDIFLKWIAENYLLNNTIYYLIFDKNKMFLNLKKIQPWYGYRVYDGNYINSDIGKFVAMNGQLRTIRKIFMAGYSISKIAYWNYALMRIFRKLGMLEKFKLEKNKGNWKAYEKYMKCLLKELKRNMYPKIIIDQTNAIIRSIIAKRDEKMENPIIIEDDIDVIYDGKDARIFYRDYEQGKLPKVYYQLINDRYDYIITGKNKMSNVKRIMDFLSLDCSLKEMDGGK